MLKALQIANFKSLGEGSDHFRMAPITLVYGPNSAGKSSLIQSLLLLKQSTQNLQNIRHEGYLKPIGNTVDLGSLASLIHKHDSKKSLQFSFQIWENSDHASWSGYALEFILTSGKLGSSRGILKSCVLAEPSADGEIKGLGFEKCSDRESVSILKELQSRMKQSSDETILKNLVRILGAVKNSDFYKITKSSDVQGYDALVQKKRKYNLKKLNKELPIFKKNEKDSPVESLKERFWAHETQRGNVSALPNALINLEPGDNLFWMYGLSSEFLPITRSISRMNTLLERTLSSISYLGPLRSAPQRLYRIGRESKLNIGLTGDKSIPVIYHDLLSKSGKDTILAEINRICSEFEIPYECNLGTYGSDLTGAYVALELTDKRTNTKVLPTDVGFGISQLLPILIEGIIAKFKDDLSIICVEQPEIHLHPRLQALVSDFLISTITPKSSTKRGSKTSNKDRRDTQWIIETHSEAMIHRIQRRVKEGVISKDDVSVLYVEPMGAKGSRIIELRLDEGGEFIDPWPDGFFVDSLQDIFQRI